MTKGYWWTWNSVGGIQQSRQQLAEWVLLVQCQKPGGLTVTSAKREASNLVRRAMFCSNPLEFLGPCFLAFRELSAKQVLSKSPLSTHRCRRWCLNQEKAGSQMIRTCPTVGKRHLLFAEGPPRNTDITFPLLPPTVVFRHCDIRS